GGLLLELVEAHLAGVPGADHALPRDARVRLVGHDAGLPLLLAPGDVRPPVEAVHALAAHLLDALHEGGEALELPEQSVGLSDRHAHVYRLVERSHDGLLSAAMLRSGEMGIVSLR